MEKLSQYLIEVENTGENTVVLQCPARAPLLLEQAKRGQYAERVPLTSEQFLSASYDIEGFSEGKYGVEKRLAIWLTDRVSGKREVVPFDTAKACVEGGLSADDVAKQAQVEAEAAVEAERVKNAAYSAPQPPAFAPPLATAVNSALAPGV